MKGMAAYATGSGSGGVPSDGADRQPPKTSPVKKKKKKKDRQVVNHRGAFRSCFCGHSLLHLVCWLLCSCMCQCSAKHMAMSKARDRVRHLTNRCCVFCFCRIRRRRNRARAAAHPVTPMRRCLPWIISTIAVIMCGRCDRSCVCWIWILHFFCHDAGFSHIFVHFDLCLTC
jgi:hypothetical protein